MDKHVSPVRSHLVTNPYMEHTAEVCKIVLPAVNNMLSKPIILERAFNTVLVEEYYITVITEPHNIVHCFH